MEMNTLPVNGYYHICSDGNYSSALFRNTDDFKAAMNRIAVCTLRSRIVILAFVLMDNHFHFVVHCESEEICLKFINEFKRLTGKYNHDVYGEYSTLKRLPVKVIPVQDADYLKNLIGYVIKNPTKARMDMFYDYPWGTGGLYFRREANPGREESVRVSDLCDDAVRKTCRTRFKLPPEWRIDNGIILPENYVDTESVLKLFKTTRAFLTFVSANKDGEIDRDMGEWSEINMTDSELRAERILLSRKMFGTANLGKISAPERLRLARDLRRTFLCSKKQLARIVHLPYQELENKL